MPACGRNSGFNLIELAFVTLPLVREVPGPQSRLSFLNISSDERATLPWAFLATRLRLLAVHSRAGQP